MPRTTEPIRHSLSLLVLLPLVAFATTGCGSTSEVRTLESAAAPTIDARFDDWESGLTKAEDASYLLGLRNDGEYLYAAFSSSDVELNNQIMRLGLITWIDPAGGEEKAFGIRFPMGVMAAARPGGGRRQGGGAGQRPAEVMAERFAASLGEMEVLTYAGEQGVRGMRMPAAGVPGIVAVATYENGTLAYELQLPLRHSDAHEYAAGAEPGSTIGFGLETPELDRAAMRERMQAGGGARGGRGGFGGGGGPTGGRGGFGGAGRGGNRGAPLADPLSAWTVVKLAE